MWDGAFNHWSCCNMRFSRLLNSVCFLSFVFFGPKASWTSNRLWLLTGNVFFTLRLSVTGVKQHWGCVLVSTLVVAAGRRFLISPLRHLCFDRIPPSSCAPTAQHSWVKWSKGLGQTGQRSSDWQARHMNHLSTELLLEWKRENSGGRGGDLTFNGLVALCKSWKESVESFDLAFDYLFLVRTERRMILMSASWLMLPEKREDTENSKDYRKE